MFYYSVTASIFNKAQAIMPQFCALSSSCKMDCVLSLSSGDYLVLPSWPCNQSYKSNEQISTKKLQKYVIVIDKYLWKILWCSPHFLPCFIEEFYALTVELFKWFVTRIEHWMILGTCFRCCQQNHHSMVRLHVSAFDIWNLFWLTKTRGGQLNAPKSLGFYKRELMHFFLFQSVMVAE